MSVSKMAVLFELTASASRAQSQYLLESAQALDLSDSVIYLRLTTCVSTLISQGSFVSSSDVSVPENEVSDPICKATLGLCHRYWE